MLAEAHSDGGTVLAAPPGSARKPAAFILPRAKARTCWQLPSGKRSRTAPERALPLLSQRTPTFPRRMALGEGGAGDVPRANPPQHGRTRSSTDIGHGRRGPPGVGALSEYALARAWRRPPTQCRTAPCRAKGSGGGGAASGGRVQRRLECRAVPAVCSSSLRLRSRLLPSTPHPSSPQNNQRLTSRAPSPSSPSLPLPLPSPQCLPPPTRTARSVATSRPVTAVWASTDPTPVGAVTPVASTTTVP